MLFGNVMASAGRLFTPLVNKSMVRSAFEHVLRRPDGSKFMLAQRLII